MHFLTSEWINKAINIIVAHEKYCIVEPGSELFRHEENEHSVMK